MTIIDKGREMAREYNPEQYGVWDALFREIEADRNGLLEALKIAQKEMESAAYNMTQNGYSPDALPVQLLRHAASIAAGARGNA